MIALDKFTSRLNASPILWTLGLGVTVYFCAFWLAVLAIFPSFPVVFEAGFLSAGMLVMGYHWAMSRYLTGSKMAQVIHMFFGVILVTVTLIIIGSALHIKSYEAINRWLF